MPIKPILVMVTLVTLSTTAIARDNKLSDEQVRQIEQDCRQKHVNSRSQYKDCVKDEKRKVRRDEGKAEPKGNDIHTGTDMPGVPSPSTPATPTTPSY